MSDFPVGTKVRAQNPDDFIGELARKLRNRVGEVVKHQAFSGRPVVLFNPVGRRREYRWVADDRYLEVVADTADECKARCEGDK